MKRYLANAAVTTGGLLLLTFAAGLLFGKPGELPTRSLLTVYVGLGAAWVLFFTALVLNQGYALAAIFSTGLLVVAYMLCVYAIWFRPAFYAEHWRWMNILLLFTLALSPVVALLARIFRRTG